MSDILIHDVPAWVAAAIDPRAAQLGLSRNEYLCRRLSQDEHRSTSPIEVADLQRFETMFGDLADPAVTAHAWS
ncbi:MAG: type II toxin-antitoxin system VapB family antitoxin [Pseudonocardiaceae bacterium]